MISQKERVVLIRPLGKLLTMSTLQYATQVKQPSSFQDDLVETNPSEEEFEMARRLAQVMRRDDLRIAEYRDEHIEKMQALIESKVEGKEIIAPPMVEEPQVVNPMDALKAGVQRIAVPGKAEKPSKKMASSARSRAKQPTTRKRKSG